jgi:hypothetical protein
MPRVTASHCRPDSPLMCSGRAKANARGPGIWYSDTFRSWVFVPQSTYGAPIGIGLLTHCPHCGFPLPRLLDIVQRALKK